MKRSIGILCVLGLVGSLLGGYTLLLPAGSPPPVGAQDMDDGARAAGNDAGPSLLFADDFERGTGNWQLNPGEAGSWAVQREGGNQALHGVAFATALANTTWEDYRVEARVRVSSGEAKVAFRVGDQHVGYYLGLEADGVLRLDKWDGADWIPLGSDLGPYPAGEWYLLALEGEGDQLRTYVDGELAIEASDAAYTSGSPMLNVSFGEADFDDVWVTGDAPADCPVIPANGLQAPFGIAFNSQGELFVASGARVGRVTSEGEAAFFAEAGAPGDLAVDENDNMYLTDPDFSVIYRIAPDGTRTEFATFADTPWNLAIGPDGYLYVGVEADIMRVDLGDGSASLWMAGVAGAMAFDDAGNLYTQGEETTRKITPDKVVSVVTVLPTVRPYKQYTGIAVDEAGNLYVGEGLRQQGSETDPPWVPPVVADKVYQIAPDGQVRAFASGLGGVWDLAFGPDGYLYVTEHDLGGVAKIAPDGTVTPVVPCSGLAAVADVAYSPDGVLYFVNVEAFNVSRLDAQGQVVVVGSGFNLPFPDRGGSALEFSAHGDLFVTEPCSVFTQRITRITGDTATDFTHDVQDPGGLAFDETGGLYVSEKFQGNIVRFSPDGTRHPFVSGLNEPEGLAFRPDGLLYAVECGEDRVLQIDASGTITPFVTLTEPIDLVFRGDDLLVTTGTGVWQVNPVGTVTRFAGGLTDPDGITLAPDGSVVVAYWLNNSIHRYIASGTTPGAGITAPSHVGLGQPGQAVTHTFTLHNTGNGQDGFWLAAESERSWPLQVQGGTFVGPVECGLSRAVQVAVTVPAGTERGVKDTLTLTVTSRLASGVSASAQATTASSHGIYLPLVLKGAG